MSNVPLYARLLGSSWASVAEPVRLAHATETTVRARGRLKVCEGSNRTARFVARLMRLPRASDGADTRLVVTPRDGGERWLRTFEGRRVATRQYKAGDFMLAERIGILEFRFQVQAAGGSLMFRQLEAAVVFGPVRLRLPPGWAPTVEAREDAAGPRRTHIYVRVLLPALGPLLTYKGIMDYEESGA